ncbi:MAG: hypothetical protein ACRD1R_04050, partial [Acidobacteriota bacterium]
MKKMMAMSSMLRSPIEQHIIATAKRKKSPAIADGANLASPIYARMDSIIRELTWLLARRSS